MSSCSVAYWKFVEVDSGCSSAAAEQQQQPLSFLFVACRDHKLSWKLISCCRLSRWRWSVSQLPYDSCLLSAASCLFSLVCLPSSLPPCLCCRFVCCHRASYFSNSFQLVPLSFPSLFTYSFQLIWWWIMLHGVAYWLTDGCCKRQRGVSIYIRNSPMTFCSDTYEVF